MFEEFMRTEIKTQKANKPYRVVTSRSKVCGSRPTKRPTVHCVNGCTSEAMKHDGWTYACSGVDVSSTFQQYLGAVDVISLSAHV